MRDAGRLAAAVRNCTFPHTPPVTGLPQYTGWSKKRTPLTCFCNNFGKCTPILVLFSLLQQENYAAQNLCYYGHHTFIMLPLFLVKQTLMLYQCHYYVIIVFVCNLLHFSVFNHLHRLI